MNDDFDPRPHDHLVEPLFGGLDWERRESDDLDDPAPGEEERRGWWSRPWAWAFHFWRRERG